MAGSGVLHRVGVGLSGNGDELPVLFLREALRLNAEGATLPFADEEIVGLRPADAIDFGRVERSAGCSGRGGRFAIGGKEDGLVERAHLRKAAAGFVSELPDIGFCRTDEHKFRRLVVLCLAECLVLREVGKLPLATVHLCL